MGITIPDHIRSAIIQAWMMGKTRDNIAAEFNISTGSVSNIIEQWKNEIGVFEANTLRELGLGLTKTGLSPGRCLNGLRINNILNKLGIEDDHLYDFLIKIYNECQKQRLPPAELTKLVQVVNAYPEEVNSLIEIPKNIQKRRQEQIKLDADIYYKKLEIQQLDHEKERKRKEIQDLQDELESFRREIQDQKKDFLLFKDTKDELKKYNIPINALEQLTHVLKIFEEMHFSPLTIVSRFQI